MAEPSAWVTPVETGGWGFRLTPDRQNDTSVALYTREKIAEEVEAHADALEAFARWLRDKRGGDG